MFTWDKMKAHNSEHEPMTNLCVVGDTCFELVRRVRANTPESAGLRTRVLAGISDISIGEYCVLLV